MYELPDTDPIAIAYTKSLVMRATTARQLSTLLHAQSAHSHSALPHCSYRALFHYIHTMFHKLQRCSIVRTHAAWQLTSHETMRLPWSVSKVVQPCIHCKSILADTAHARDWARPSCPSDLKPTIRCLWCIQHTNTTNVWVHIVYVALTRATAGCKRKRPWLANNMHTSPHSTASCETAGEQSMPHNTPTHQNPLQGSKSKSYARAHMPVVDMCLTSTGA